MTDTAICKSCGAPMRWVITENGKRMPVDAEPTTDGRFTINPDGTAHYVKTEEAITDDAPRYTSHFSTCPNAGEHRKA